MSRSWIPLSLITGAIALFSLTASAQTIKMGTVAPEGSPWYDGLAEINQAWSALSGGKVKLRIYGGGVAGDEPDMIRKMRIGQLQGAALTTMGLMSILPDIEAISFPMNLRNNQELDQVIQTLGPRFEQQLEAKGFKAILWTSAGWVRIFSKQPVVTPADLRERKLFFWGQDAAYIELLKQSGFQPIPLPITDLLPSLQTGLIDTFAAPPAVALSFQWFGLAPHMTDLRLEPVPGMIVISAKVWDRVPQDLQPQLIEAAQAVGKRLMQKSITLEQDAIQAMQDRGLEVHPVPEPVKQEWQNLIQEKGQPVFVGPRFSKEIQDEIQAVVQPLRAPAAGE